MRISWVPPPYSIWVTARLGCSLFLDGENLRGCTVNTGRRLVNATAAFNRTLHDPDQAGLPGSMPGARASGRGRQQALFHQLNAPGEPGLLHGIALRGGLSFLQLQVGQQGLAPALG